MTTLDLALYQDVLGQLPRLKTYTHILLGFALPRNLSHTGLVELLERSSRDLVDAFPWLSCRVVQEGSGPNNSGTFTLATCPDFTEPNSLVRTKHCTHALPTYEEILNAKGPVNMLDGSALAPVPAFPKIYDDSDLNPAPVFTLQANFISGGLLLDAAAQHNFIDGGGLLRLLELLGKAMRDEPFSAQEIQDGNRDRRDIVALLRPNEPMLDHTHLLREPLSNGQPPILRPQARWNFVRFPVDKKIALKDRASQNIQDAAHGTFVSTNDTLCAFIWKRIVAVREQKIDSSASSKFSRALDARRALGVPREYLGQMGFNASCRMTFGELQEHSLGQVALFLRQAARNVNNEHSVRSWATFIEKEKDKSKIMFGGEFNPDTDVGVSSLIHASVSGVDFGVLGKPDFVRRPKFLPLEGCIYLWTQTVNGDVDVLMCLKEEDWEGLRRDKEWEEYTEFIG